MMNRKHFAITVGIALIVQLAVIGSIIMAWEKVVTKGTVCRFECTGYDPSDPFRGRYVMITVVAKCDQICTNNFAADIGWWRTHPLAVKVVPGENTNELAKITMVKKMADNDGGLWLNNIPVRISHSLSWSDRRKDEAYEAFEARQEASPKIADVKLPNQFFMNEKLAPEAENLLRRKDAKRIAVYRVYNGKIVLTDIEIDGQSISKLALKTIAEK